jgi:hypothetical protein
MGSLSAEALRERMKCAWDTKELWRSQMQDAYALCFPSRNLYDNGRTPGDQPGLQIYDSTLLAANINLANKIQADSFPSFDEWMKLIPGVAFEASVSDPRQREQVQQELAGVNAVHQAAMEVSNFDSVANEMLLDYNVGTGMMMVTEGDGFTPLVYVGVNPAQVALEEGPGSQVWAYYRKHPIFARNVRPTWGEYNFNPPPWWDEWAGEAENNKSRIVIEEACYFDYDADTWYFIILGPNSGDDTTADDDEMVKLVDRPMKDTVWLSPRWNKEAGEVYGRGPVLSALPNAKVLNKTIELILKNASITLFPPMTYVDDMDFNPAMFSMAPGYLNPVSRNGGPLGKAIEPLEVGGDLRMAQLVLEELKASIKKLMLDDQLPPPTGAVHSPTEIMARQKELQRNEGAPFGRLQKEFTRPLAQKNLNILHKKGLIDKIQVDGLIIDLQVMNPQADVQNEEAVLKLQRVIEVSQAVQPELPLLTLNVEGIPRYVADKLGVPMSLVRSVVDTDRMQEQVAQLQQEQQPLQQEQPAGV